VYSHRAELVHRADQLDLLFPIEIDQSEELEFAVSEQHPHHVLILRPGRSFLFGVGAKWIRPAASERCGQQLLIRRNDQRLKTLDRNVVSGLHDRPFAGRSGLVAVEPFLSTPDETSTNAGSRNLGMTPPIRAT